MLGKQALRVGVDFHVFDGKYQGSRSHLLGLYTELLLQYPQHRYFFFLRDVEALRAVAIFRRDNVSIVRMRSLGSVMRLLWQLPLLRRRLRLDILHAQYIVPPWRASGTAVTIHDILFEHYPQYFSRLFVLRSRWLVRRSARSSDFLFTVSDYSRRELIQRYGIEERRITVLHNAVDAARFHPGSTGEQFLRLRGLATRAYILSVGRIEPRKNYVTLLRAYARMTGEVPRLVIVGQKDFDSGDFEVALAALPASRRVTILPDVTDDELPALYRHALAFAYPSFAEGFGMPPLEAMASGIPVVTSNTTAIPEVVGDAAILIDPSDEHALCGALERLCTDAALRDRLTRLGLERARSFSWKRSAAGFASACGL